MKLRRLGDSELEVSEISLGSWLTYSGGIEREQTEACTRAAFDAQINFFDTANVYGTGAAEEAWGEILSDYDRDSYVLATKVYFPMSEEDFGLSREQIAKQIDASLARLRTDYVDLYQCHRFDPDVEIEETMEALTEVVESGKARYLGFSEWHPEQIRAALEVPGAAKFVSSQPQYNAIWRAPEAELFELCAAHGISQIVWSPLAQGVLTGKYEPGREPPEDSRAASDEMSFAIERYMDDAGARGGRAAAEGGRGRRARARPAGARLDPAPARGRLGDRRRLAPGAGARERLGIRDRALGRDPEGDRRGARRGRDHRGPGRQLRPRGCQAPRVMKRAALAALALAALAAPAAATAPATAERPAPRFRVLVYSEPDSFHASVGSVQAAVAAVEEMGERRSFAVASRTDPVVFKSEVLRRYDAVVMVSPDGEVLDRAQQRAFERYIRAGGGFVGVHAVSLAEPDWPFFVDLVGARFVTHPPIQEATLRVTDRDHPSTRGLPRPWIRSDEWYEFDRNPRGSVHVLATVDESTYEGGAMGADHPISWCRRFRGGRSWYTAMGHPPESYSEPGLRRHLLGGIRWAAGDKPGDCG